MRIGYGDSFFRQQTEIDKGLSEVLSQKYGCSHEDRTGTGNALGQASLLSHLYQQPAILTCSAKP